MHVYFAAKCVRSRAVCSVRCCFADVKKTCLLILWKALCCNAAVLAILWLQWDSASKVASHIDFDWSVQYYICSLFQFSVSSVFLAAPWNISEINCEMLIVTRQHCMMYIWLSMSEFWAEICCEMWNVQRKQKEVEKANNFYYQLLQKALPSDEDATNDKPKGAYHWTEDCCT